MANSRPSGLPTRCGATVALAVVAMSCTICTWYVETRASRFKDDKFNFSDALYYKHVCDRVRNGEGYYESARIELPAHGFNTDSVLNWRTPLYAHACALLMDTTWCQSLSMPLSFCFICLAFEVARRETGVYSAAFAALICLGSTLWWIDPEPALYTEYWAGLLIALSVTCKYYNIQSGLLLLATAALFLRELCLPFFCISLFFTWRESSRVRKAAWIAAAVLYAMYYLAHYSSVERKQLEIGGGHGMDVSSWVQFGGLGFVLETARMNYLAALLPLWCTALYLPLGLFGLAALGLGVGGMRISLATPALYVLLFSVIGRAYNSYWGWLIAPILGFGFSLSPYYLWKYLNVALTNTTEGDRN